MITYQDYCVADPDAGTITTDLGCKATSGVLNRKIYMIIVAMLLLSIAPAWAQEELGYYRFPAIHGETIVFAAEGDLWRVSIQGGIAQRLTTHPNEEIHPAISPDGKTLAFVARYEGPSEVYTMPLSGGLPVRRTYEAERSTVVGWTPKGELLYTTSHYSTLPDAQLVSLNLEDDTRTRIPLSQASEASYDSTGKKLFFVRPAFHGNVTKRYLGGTARKIWKFVEGAEEAVPLTEDYAGESHSPMWAEGRVYFVTARDGTMNIWSMDESGGDLTQHTSHSGWDVRHPSLGQDRIVYQLGADLWIYELDSNRARSLSISLSSDFDQLRERWVKKPMEYLTSVHLHPKGQSVVLTSRGRVFVAPAAQGRLVQASVKEGVRYRDAVFMPDGRVLALSDESGEMEFELLPGNGVGSPETLTDDGAILRFTGHPSPDGKRVAYSDRNQDLWILDVNSGKQVMISSNREGIGSMVWSPDSRWLIYTMDDLNRYSRLYLYDTDGATTTALTSDRVNSMSPAFSADGKWLYFLSDRNLVSLVGNPWGPRQPEPYFDKTMKIYQIALRKGLRPPFKPADELNPETEKKEKKEKEEEEEEEKNEEKESEPIEVDLQGIALRIWEVPVKAGNYSRLSANEKTLFWRAREDSKSQLMALKITNKNPKPVKLVDEIRYYELSMDGKKTLVRKKGDFYIFDAGANPPSKLDEKKIDLSAWTYSIDVREDWRQIFVDAWRLERDYFYDPNMHGVDWDGTLKKYMPLVNRVTTRNELSDLIGRVIGELSALHTSVRGGDVRTGPDEVKIASLGARLKRVPNSGGYLIDYIYRSEPDFPNERSPLADPELGIKEGDVIESVNGIAVLSVNDIGRLLRNQQRRQVLLEIRSKGTEESRKVVVVPTGNEWSLRYTDWEYTRRLAVDKKGEGKIGYVHLRAMGGAGISAWYRHFYPVHNRQGLIVDMRHNPGGNIDSIILEKLLRRAWFYWSDRTGSPYWNMQYAFRGHMVVLCDRNTGSDGEAFTEGFKRLGLGKAIGTRTWGGEIWGSSSNRLSDGGIARAPMNGVYGPEREWLIEGHGVVPDIVVDNLPHATFKGEDAQLEAGIEYLLEEIRKDPRDVPAPPPYPDKSFVYPERTK